MTAGNLNFPVAATLPAARTVVLAVGDAAVRDRIRATLTEMRWQVHEATGGAAALACLDELRPEALILDECLPDIGIGDVVEEAQKHHPETDLLRADGAPLGLQTRSPRRHELLQALRELPDQTDRPSGQAASTTVRRGAPKELSTAPMLAGLPSPFPAGPVSSSPLHRDTSQDISCLPEMIGTSPAMAELGRLVRLVAPRSTSVLIEGETGTGKELVAKALHRLSSRANKPFLVLNCAAIPEALLEAELFGHTRGAFTGAVRSRTGRIEAADGGTLFLDEIGEMPLALQAKMLRFLECGELQRVGDNEPTYVDVRVIAATHQPLEQRAEEQTFRLDLYHRLAVFPLDVPTLRSRVEDIPLLAEHFLSVFARGAECLRITDEAMNRLREHSWPGNVRELMHVLERAAILVGTALEIDSEHVRVRQRDRSPAKA